MNTKIINEIDEITKKINENFSKNLKGRGVDDFLEEINADLEYLVKNSEEKHKQIISEEVREFQTTISKNIEERSPWIKVQNSLSEVKKGLETIKGEIEEFEKLEQEKINKDREELAEWRNLFPKQEPKQVAEMLRKLATSMEEEQNRHKKELEELQKVVDEAAKSSSPNFLEVAEGIRKTSESYTNLGANIGKDTGLSLVLQPAGALIGVAGAVGHGVIETGAYFADRGIGVADDSRKDLKDFSTDAMRTGAELATKAGDNLTDVTKEVINKIDFARRDAKDFTENMTKLGADSIENFRAGAENVTKEAIKGMTSTTEATVKAGIGLQIGGKTGGLRVGIGVGENETAEVKLVAAEEIIARLEQQIENQKQALEKKQLQIDLFQQQQSQTSLVALQIAQTLATSK